jgi:hypothetical protein
MSTVIFAFHRLTRTDAEVGQVGKSHTPSTPSLPKNTLLGVESPAVVFGQLKLAQSRIERLEAMGIPWSLPKVSWEKRFQELVAFKVSFFSARYRNVIIISSPTLTRAFY